MSRYLLQLPAVIVTGFLLVLLLLPLGQNEPTDGWSLLWLVVATSVPIMFVVAWAFALYCAANRKTHVELKMSWLFIVTLIGIPLLFTIVGLARFDGEPHLASRNALQALVLPLGLATITACFACSWFAAAALHRFESSSTVARIFGTFLLITYLVIGIWFLTERIENLMHEPID